MKRWITAGITTILTIGLFAIQLLGVGPVPPLGSTLAPTTGVWTITKGATLPTSTTYATTGAPGTSTVSFSPAGIADVHAPTSADLWYTIGYLEGRQRLFEMDLLRREASGSLAAVLGPSSLASDEFELRLGLLRTARQNLAALSSSDLSILTIFAKGVNAARAYDLRTHSLPATFRLLNYTPAPWTPLDSMLVQGFMTQMLDYTQNPIDYTILANHLGFKRTMQLFPEIPVNPQSPYDTGPYRSTGNAPVDPPITVNAKAEQAASAIAQMAAALPSYAIHHFSNSNNWAVSGRRTATGLPILAGDPHLNQTLPSIWYWLTAHAPGISFAGVAVPGLPIVLIGRNASIAWSLTNVENQATFFYHDTTSSAHPNDYLYKGVWRPFRYIRYRIRVKGAAAHTMTVALSVNGPVMTERGETVSVDWLGNNVSPDLSVLLQIIHAKNWYQFHTALSRWKTPSQNFVFADRSGAIGLISAGTYPIFRSGDPWMILSGTGGAEITGSIPYANEPQSYNPTSGFVFSANQRPVTASYPYYIGTSFDFFTNGYRADEIRQFLSTHKHLSVTEVERLQNSTTDYLATQLVPWLLKQFNGVHEPSSLGTPLTLLSHWNDSMTANSSAATIWWTFLGNELQDVFGPYYKAANVPQPANSSLVVNQLNSPLVEDLQWMDLSNPTDSFLTPPGATVKRSAATVARLALTQTVSQLDHKLGPNPNKWLWGRIHRREFPSLTGAAALAYGPRGASGDTWTVDAADGNLLSEAGPSWRMIVAFGRTGHGIIPGGQSENPLSPWYANQINDWWTGHYLPFGLSIPSTLATWTLRST
ncbi:MAG: penicillin acylase family protein [Ferrimicrobium sp.]